MGGLQAAAGEGMSAYSEVRFLAVGGDDATVFRVAGIGAGLRGHAFEIGEVFRGLIVASPAVDEFGAAFTRSIHIIVVDAGDCGACLNEVKQLNNPYYNMHRLGFFITPTPRHADVLLVVGAVTDHMRFVVQKIYDAMPTPKRVVAVGVCAVSGGVFADSFVCANGLADVLPVDVEVPGHPPPPLAILHGLLVAVGRQVSASLVSPPPANEPNLVTR